MGSSSKTTEVPLSSLGTPQLYRTKVPEADYERAEAMANDLINKNRDARREEQMQMGTSAEQGQRARAVRAKEDASYQASVAGLTSDYKDTLQGLTDDSKTQYEEAKTIAKKYKSVVPDDLRDMPAQASQTAGDQSAITEQNYGGDLTKLYQDLLNRDPDMQGYQHYLDQLTGGRTLDEIKAEIAGSNEAFLRNTYMDILKRDPDEGGMQHYMDQLSGGRPRDEIYKEILGSDEYKKKFGSGTGSTMTLDSVYQDLLGRAPDEGGRQHYEQQMAGGRTIQEIYDQIEGGNEKFVRDVYRDVLQREPDKGGKQNYMKQLQEGRSRDEIRAEILGSEEYRNKFGTQSEQRQAAPSSSGSSGSSAPAERPSTQEEIAKAYRDLLGREPDEGGLRHYTEKVASGESIEQIRSNISSGNEAFLRDAYQSGLGREPDKGGKQHYMRQLQEGRSREDILKEIRESEEARNRR